MSHPCVLIFAGSDPGGGAGVQADIQSVAAGGAHPLSVITALTVQDNNRVFSVHPTAPELVTAQAKALIDVTENIAAIKIGIVGSAANARAIAALLRELKHKQPDLPVVLDTVLASGRGSALANDDPIAALQPLLPLATLITPNLPEAARLCGGEENIDAQAAALLIHAPHVLIKGGHGDGGTIVNRWFHREGQRQWSWPRIAGEFHGTGCTLASAIAARLARGFSMEDVLDAGQAYCHRALEHAYAIAPGQRMPARFLPQSEEHAKEMP